MTTKVKTTVTFTLSITHRDERSAIVNLLDWMAEYQNDDNRPVVARDCESGEYTIRDNHTVANSFKFNDVAELAQKYGTHFSLYELARALLDYGSRESVTAKSEIIEVEEAK